MSPAMNEIADDPSELMQQGLQLHQAGQLQDAEQTFRRVRAATVVKNVVPGLKIAFKKTNGGTINCAVRFFVIESVNVHGLIITNS